MTDRSAANDGKGAKKGQKSQNQSALHEAKLAEEASRAKAIEAEKIKAQSAETAFGTPLEVHRTSPTGFLPGHEPSTLSATVKDGKVVVKRG